MDKRPTPQEVAFLTQAYNFLYDIHEEVLAAEFSSRDFYYRFSRLKDAFLVYSEVLEYEPIGWFIEALRRQRPPMEAEIAEEYFQFIRNLLIHFPFFKSWDEVVFNKALINWSKPGRTIDRFLTRFAGHAPVKYRVWIADQKRFEYVDIGFPKTYDAASQICLHNLMEEKSGAIFSLSLMRQVLDSQVEQRQMKFRN